MSCRVVLSPVPTLGGDPGSKRTCPLWTTQQNPLSQHPPKPNSSTGSSPHPKRHASPITRPVAPQPRHFNCCQASPTTTAQHPVRGLPRQHAVERKSQATSRAPRMPNQAPSRLFLFHLVVSSSRRLPRRLLSCLSLIEPCFPCLLSPSLC